MTPGRVRQRDVEDNRTIVRGEFNNDVRVLYAPRKFYTFFAFAKLLKLMRSFPATPSWRPQRSTACSEHPLALWEVHASHQVYVARISTQAIIALVVLHVEKPAVALFERFIQPRKRLFFVAQTHV